MVETVKRIENIYHLEIGVQGENIATAIQMDMSTWAAEFPTASFHVLFKRYNEINIYPVVTEFENNILTWIPTLTDTAIPGVGFAEVRAIEPNTGLIKKSRIIPTSVEHSVSGQDSGTVPEPFEDWVNIVLAARDTTEEYRDETKVYRNEAETAAGIAVSSEHGGLIMFEINALGELVMTYTVGVPYMFELTDEGELIYYVQP